MGTDYQREDIPKNIKNGVTPFQKDARTKRNRQNNIPDHTKKRIPEGKRPREYPKKQYYSASNTVPNSRKDAVYNRVDDVYASSDNALFTNAIEKAGFNPYGHKANNPKEHYKRPKKPSKQKEDTRSMWNLQTYEGVVDALITGHKVYFTAQTKNCYYDKALRRDKTTFGDYVDVFEMHKDFSEKQPHRYLQFSFKRMHHMKRKGKLTQHTVGVEWYKQYVIHFHGGGMV